MKRRKSSHFFFLQTWIWCFFWMRRRVKMNTSIWEGAVIKQHNSKVKFHLTQKAVPIIGWWKKKCQESDFKGMLFENSPWAGTVIKLSMITLFFISELIFREITWWWTKPEWWPGRRNSLVSEIKVASSGDLESFVGTRCFFSVAWPNPPEHSLEAGGGWWRLAEAGGSWRRANQAPGFLWDRLEVHTWLSLVGPKLEEGTRIRGADGY